MASTLRPGGIAWDLSRVRFEEGRSSPASGGAPSPRLAVSAQNFRLGCTPVVNLFETTAEVEVMCVRLATFRITPIERSRLQNMHVASGELVRTGDIGAYGSFNREFHQAIYRATHNQFLAEQAIGIRARMAAFRRTQLRQGDRLVRSHAEHGEILNAVARGDGEEAARCMRAHMLNASCALTSYIQEMKLD